MSSHGHQATLSQLGKNKKKKSHLQIAWVVYGIKDHKGSKHLKTISLKGSKFKVHQASAASFCRISLENHDILSATRRQLKQRINDKKWEKSHF